MLYGILSGAIFYYYYPKLLSKWNKTVSYLSRFSFGVFFVHVAILDLTLDLVIDKYDLFSPAYFAVGLILIIGLSFAFSIILSRIKLVDRILGLRS